MKKMNFNQAGDTIVEVLIAIGVVSLVLSGAFTISNRSSNSIQDAQEHTEALKAAQSQLEQLKEFADTSGTDNSTPTPKSIYNTSYSNFCIAAGGKISTTACNFNSLGGFPYTVKINFTHHPNPYTYSVAVTWDSLLGGKDNVTLFYNLDN